MATIRKMTYTAEEAPAGTPEEMVHIENLPGGGSPEIGDGSVTTAKLAAGAVTGDKIANGTISAGKLAGGVIPTVPGNATTSAPGLVKQATFVADPAGDTPTKAEFVALRDALVTAGIMAAS